MFNFIKDVLKGPRSEELGSSVPNMSQDTYKNNWISKQTVQKVQEENAVYKESVRKISEEMNRLQTQLQHIGQNHPKTSQDPSSSVDSESEIHMEETNKKYYEPQKEKEELQKKLKTQEKELEQLHVEEKKLLKYKEDYETLAEDLENLKKENEKLKDKNKKLEWDWNTAKENKIHMEETNKKLQKEKEELQEKLTAQKKELEKYKKLLETKEKEHKRYVSDVECKIEDYVKMHETAKGQLQQKTKEIETIRMQHSDTKAQLEKQRKLLDTERNEHSKVMSELNRRIEENNEKLAAAEEELKQNATEIETITQAREKQYRESTSEIEKLQEKLVEMEQNQADKVAVNFHSTLKPHMFTPIVEIIMEKLVDSMRKQNVTLVRQGSPTLVICFNVSRLGTDVKDSIKDLGKVNEDVAVLVFHHKEKHALPSQSSCRMLAGLEYKQLGAIVDVAYLSEKGIYDCEMNTTAFIQIESFLQKYIQKS